MSASAYNCTMEKAHVGLVVKKHRERMHPKVTQEKLAAMIPISRTYMADIERGHKMPSVEVRLALIRMLHIKPSEIFDKEDVDRLLPFHNGAVPSETPQGRVPLISWVHAGELEHPFDPYLPAYAEDWYPSSVRDPGAFALAVEGDSMEPEFAEGEIIVASPNTEPQSGDFVVVKINGQATLKQVFIHLNKIVLKPLNETYEPIEVGRSEEFSLKIVGRVKQKIKNY
jgi:SOS-response transcriptional repressor LexA